MTTEESRVSYETRDEGSIALIKITRARYRNALSQPTVAAIDEAMMRAADDPVVRVIILGGDGPSFSAGHDLGSPDAMARRAARSEWTMAERYANTRAMDVDPHLRWRNIPKPTIAMVQGHCIYAAWMLASAMDLIFAADDAQFLPTNFAYFAVPWDLGARRSLHLLYDSRFLSAEEAREWGLVQEVHPAADLEARTLEYAARVAKQDPFQLQMMKHSVHQMQEMQGFTAHILSSYSDRMVRGANRPEVPARAPEEDGRRHVHVRVEQARNAERGA